MLRLREFAPELLEAIGVMCALGVVFGSMSGHGWLRMAIGTATASAAIGVVWRVVRFYSREFVKSAADKLNLRES
jgi:aspartate/methionine/tyrosine aminotransferase